MMLGSIPNISSWLKAKISKLFLRKWISPSQIEGLAYVPMRVTRSGCSSVGGWYPILPLALHLPIALQCSWWSLVRPSLAWLHSIPELPPDPFRPLLSHTLLGILVVVICGRSCSPCIECWAPYDGIVS